MARACSASRSTFTRSPAPSPSSRSSRRWCSGPSWVSPWMASLRAAPSTPPWAISSIRKVCRAPHHRQPAVSDEYGPSLYEFHRDGTLARAFKIPENLPARNADGSYNFDGDGVTGRRTNRGFEGLAISPDGTHVYAMLQSAMVDEGGGNGFCNRIVKFETATGTAVAQFAYQMDGASQGRGISALVAVNGDDFLVLERNNRGVGVGAGATPPNKKVFRISLAGATDVSDQDLEQRVLSDGHQEPDAFPRPRGQYVAELGNRVPEKWEGLAIGPRLSNGNYVVLAGTDNDYSVTQNGSGTQFDEGLRVADRGPSFPADEQRAGEPPPGVARRRSPAPAVAPARAPGDPAPPGRRSAAARRSAAPRRDVPSQPRSPRRRGPRGPRSVRASSARAMSALLRLRCRAPRCARPQGARRAR